MLKTYNLIEFFIFYLVFWWVMTILYKNNFIFNKLEKVGHRFKANGVLSNFFLSLSECKFCIENHASTLGAICYFSYCLDYKVLFWGLFCASINSWLREF